MRRPSPPSPRGRRNRGQSEARREVARVLLSTALLLGLGAGGWWWWQGQTHTGRSATPYAQMGTDQKRSPGPSEAASPGTGPSKRVEAAPTPPQTAARPAQTPVPPRPRPSAAIPAPPPLPAAAPEVRFSGPLPRSADGWYALGAQLRRSDPRRAAKAFAQAAALNPSAANWRALADAQVALGDYAAATRAYDQAVRRYQAAGDAQTARALAHLADPFRQTLDVMQVTRQSGPTQTGSTQTGLARLEPPRGVLLGIYADSGGVMGAWGQPPRIAPRLRDFAVVFRYWKFTASTDPAQVFPGRFAQAARAGGQALHLALEPGMPLGQLSDAVIHRFAAQARAAGVPIFVRFASEMNDPGNAWSRDPALYRRTFARVAHILHAEAPNVATVWMPMPGDLSTIARYYPGPGAVDWAGLSLYSVPFENGDRRQPRLNAHPLDLLDGFYRQYAPRHPIQLSEYAASSRSGAAPGQDFGAYAARQLREVYLGAWLCYPRLKNINWLDLDMHADPASTARRAAERRNDYRLFGVPAKWQAFREVRGEGALFGSYRQAQCRDCRVAAPRPWPTRVPAGQALSGALWVQTARPTTQVYVLLDGRPVPVGSALPYRFALTPAKGRHVLEVRAYAGTTLLARTRQVFVAEEGLGAGG